MKKLFKNLFNKKQINVDFFGEEEIKNEDPIIGVFKEYKYSQIYREYEFKKSEALFTGAWIHEAKNNNHNYQVIYY